ncbi:FliH/SctL family protein [Phaeovulum vinaykumarii]|uniref:Flagellar assembly protein FliH n=1 Tax=Phaeovulum vinaykumarii TaxID=407234 RepID=A0A1N7KAY4_9RHOB|nr:hypothetical protein [Phaeovulum vinaykumarii]SIS58765.1 flagellar assembly protein FliH [Phaeovulum vinaykumarii]SOB93910.1 flagellar assembly protein FliH [Phaeovulum vinaykumarii]
MALPFQLETFEVADPRTSAQEVRMTPIELDEVKAASYEQGYAAGWDDALAAQEAETARLHAELARSLQELSFTYAEARGHILQSLEPLLRDMVDAVLPTLARETLAAHVLEQIRPEAERLADMPISVAVSPLSRAAVEGFLTERCNLPLSFVEEASLSEGQVYLRMGDAGTRIDLDSVLKSISGAVTTFFGPDRKEAAND